MKRAWKDDRIQAEMAGMTRETQAGMKLSRIVEPDWYVSAFARRLVETDTGPAIVGDVEHEQGSVGGEDMDYESECFERFLRLADGSAADVITFSDKYGMLGLCEHGLPWEHQKDDPSGPDGTCSLMQATQWVEPVSTWLSYSAEFRGVLRLASEMHRGRPTHRDTWHSLVRDSVLSQYPGECAEYAAGDRDMPPKADWGYLDIVVNQHLRWAGVRPKFTSLPAQLLFSSYTLFGYLVVELAMTIMKVDGLLICDGCGSPYIPKNRPRTGTRNFCATCRKNKVPEKLAMRRYRARKRDMNET